jgi:hypothetical protein
MDAQGGEKLDYMERLYCILAQDATERGVLRDDLYYLGDTVLMRFKLFQSFSVDTFFPGSRVHQAYLIWAQSGLRNRRAIAEANGFPMTDQPILPGETYVVLDDQDGSVSMTVNLGWRKTNLKSAVG